MVYTQLRLPGQEELRKQLRRYTRTDTRMAHGVITEQHMRGWTDLGASK